MAFKELRQNWDEYQQLRARQLADGDNVEPIDRMMQLQLFFDMASSLDSIAYSYSAMLKLQQERSKPAGR